MRLDDTVAIVTGANQGLGKEMARAFVAEGADVVCTARTERRLLRAVAEIADGPGTALPVAANVRDWAQVRDLVETAEDVYGGVDVLVNNAGVNQESLTKGDEDLVEDVPVERWDTIQETNVRGSFLCTKAVVPGMKARGAGELLHIGSSHGLAGRPNRTPYCTSKFGQEGFHQSLALEFADADSGLRSTMLSPPRGGVVSGMTDHRDEGDMEGLHSTDVMAEPAVKLVAGGGENGGRYQVNADGETYETLYTMADFA